MAPYRKGSKWWYIFDNRIGLWLVWFMRSCESYLFSVTKRRIKLPKNYWNFLHKRLKYRWHKSHFPPCWVPFSKERNFCLPIRCACQLNSFSNTQHEFFMYIVSGIETLKDQLLKWFYLFFKTKTVLRI